MATVQPSESPGAILVGSKKVKKDKEPRETVLVESEKEGDKEEERDTWTGRLDFVLASIGYACRIGQRLALSLPVWSQRRR